ncbi:Tensin-1 [Mizuhopecten yessoensis]|uniref:Tensin-1 n=1 Tax=Mizuhopecten yessoensis TaxID=6573 RepID=A0A210QKF0_MIZYE|nr:Tensin-1 [Mizuhopecten yessoensis]
MLKFVSRKPPKGKTGNQHYSDYHYQEPQAPKVHQTRLFRPRVSSGMRSPPNFDPLKGDKSHIHMSDNAGRDSLGYDATSEGQAECVYDNLDKVRDRSKQMQENGQDISFDSSDLTRSRSPSNLSSESSPYGSLRKKYEKFQDPRRSGHGYRHVTWSPDVTNGDNLPMISEKYVAANSHGQSPYNLATRTYMADDYVHRKPDMSHLRYTVGNVKDCIQTVPGPNVHGSGRTVNMSEQFRGDKRANVSDMYTSRNKPVQSKLMTSTDSNLSDLQLGPCQFPRDLDQSLGEPSSLTDSGPNYAYYTTLPANFSTRSNFVFSPRICSTPVKDLSKTKEKPRLKVIIPPKEKDFQLTNQHTFPSHVTNKCGSDDGNDEYDNIDIETDQKDYRRKTSEVARQEAFKTDNISARHQDVGKWKTQSSQSKTNYPGLFCTSQSEPRQKDQPMQQSPARQSDMMDQGPKQVRRGFPRLFLPKENSWKKTPVSGHPTTCTTTTVESTGFQAEDKRDRHYHHFDSLVRSPRIIPEPKRVETGPVLYQQIRKVGEGQDKDGYPVGRYTEQPPTHKLWEGRDIYNKGGYQEGRFMEQPSSHKVMTSCVPQVNHEVKHEAVKKYQYSPREPPASGSNTPGANMSSLRDMINRAQVEEDHLVLDLVYITERIISMSFPSDEHEVTYSYNLKEVMNMLRTKHDDNCLVINLSEPRQDLEKFNPKHVIDYGWPDYLAPPLERLCNICKAMDSWLSTDPRHVVVVHCKGSTSRIAVIIAAFMHYCSICASADQALDRFAMKRFYDDKLGGITLPSQIRYIEYFYGLLSGAIKINSNPLYLHHIVIHGVPNFDTQGGCRPFIKVYQGMQNIFTSGVYNVTDQMQKVCISISPGIPLRGDIMIKCYHKKAKTGQREVVWACQFHTCAISGYTLTFAKKDLDDARTDPRFPDGGKVEFVFGNSQDSNVRVTDFKSDVTVPVDDGSDALVRWDSYENFSHVKNADGTVNDVNENSVTSSSREGATRSIREQHSQGPVDGSLYATVTKRKHEHVETTSGSLFQNGTTSHDQQNGSHTSSVDSGIAGNTSSNMNTTSTSVNITPQYTSNVNNNDSLHQSFSSTLNSSKSSYNNGVSSGQKKTVPPLDEQTQLDMILSDLLNDSVFVSTPQSPPKSGANSVSKDTRTFRTYDTQATPDGKTTYQTAEVTYKIPGGFKEERNYSMTKTEEKSYVPKNAFSYTSGPTSPELQRKDESPKTHSLPYRTDYDNRYYTNNESSFNRTMDSSRSMSPNEQTSSWLQEQQQKLRQRKDSKDDKTVQQERQLVEELKTAQNKYFMKRANNQAEEQATMETYRTASSPPPVANGPVSSSYVVTQNHAYSTDRSAHEPVRSFSPPGFTGDSFYNTSYTSTSTSSTQKPPPSPGQQRAQPPLTSPVIPPVRSSSKDFMQRSRNTSTSSWQGRIGQREPEQEVKPPIIRAISVTTPPQSPRPFSPVQQQQTYQVSKSRTSVEQQHPQRDQSLDIQMTLPVHAPTKTKVTEVQEFTHPEGQKKSHYITEVYVHRTAGADGTGTTQRSTTAEQKEKVERERNRLEELEKSLQAASNSIIATTPWQQQQQQQLQQQQQQKSYSTTERHVTRRVDTRKYETQQQQQHHQQQQSVSSYDGHGEVPPLSPTPHQRSTSPEWDNMNMHGSVTVSQVQAIAPPPPKQISVVEEDKISLRPIGPGVQTLEPEGMGTMGRSGATTPSFPVSPVASADLLYVDDCK